MGNTPSSFKESSNEAVVHKTAIARLREDIQTYGNCNKLLTYVLNEVNKYIENIETFNMTELELIDYFNLKHGEYTYQYFGAHYNDLENMIYQSNASDMNHNSPRMIIHPPTHKPSNVSFVHEFINTIRNGDYFHNALNYLKKDITLIWNTSEHLQHYMLVYSLIKGNNMIYVDFLKMMQHWIKHVIDAFPEDNFDNELFKIADVYLNKTIPHVNFRPINEMLKETIYNNEQYAKMFGNVGIYFYIDDNNLICTDVMHQFCDKNGVLMKKRLDNMNDNFNWDDYNPIYYEPKHKCKKIKFSSLS